jgi:hypothetical protein
LKLGIPLVIGPVLVAALFAAPVEPPFVESTDAALLSFLHRNGMKGGLHLPEIMGPGAALADFDGDGDLDVFLVQGGDLDGDGRPAAATGGARLWRNERRRTPRGGPERSFVDATTAFEIPDTGYGMGVATGDFDNDGWIDVFLAQYGTDRLLRNDRGRRFVDATDALGPAVPGWSVSATFFDYDRDGWLDLFVARYVEYKPVACVLASTRRDYCGPRSYRPIRDRLLRNRGDGRFEDVTERVLGPHAPAPGLGVVAADLDQDGWLDLYVANDGANNHLWLNDRGTRFREAGLLAGVAVAASGQPEGSMGVDAGDADDDGDLDLFVTNLAGEGHALYINAGRGVFDDRSIPNALAMASLRATGFGTQFLDYDNDGRLDLLTVNGAVHFDERRPPTAEDPLPLAQEKQLFRNVGAARFEVPAAAATAALSRPDVSRGLAVGDIDDDGDPDALVANTNGPPRLLINGGAGPSRPWLGLRLLDGKRDALGALVRVQRKGAHDLVRRVHTDGSYASACDARVLFGLGGGAEVRGAVVTWSDGSQEEFPLREVGRYVTLERGAGRPPAGTSKGTR